MSFDMTHISVVREYGFVVRRGSLVERGVELSNVLEAFEVGAPLDSDEFLLSFGPSFDEEAADEFVRRLSALGLEYIDDFFVFSGDFPGWCEFSATLGGED